MSLAFSRLSWWVWSGKSEEPKSITTSGLLGTSAESNLWDSDTRNLKFPLVKRSNAGSSSRKVKRKWQSREERKSIVDREYDVVIVPSDGVCVSCSDESDESDYSIGWLEPHGTGFHSDDDEPEDGAFAVLVRCYAHNSDDARAIMKNNVFSAIAKFPEAHRAGAGHVQEFLASLRSNEIESLTSP